MARGAYRNGIRVYANGSSSFPDRKKLVIEGSYTADFKDRGDQTTQLWLPTWLIAEWGGETDIAFENLCFVDSPIAVSAGTSSTDYSYFDALARRGSVKVGLRNVTMRTDFARTLDASAGRFSVVELDLSDVLTLARDISWGGLGVCSIRAGATPKHQLSVSRQPSLDRLARMVQITLTGHTHDDRDDCDQTAAVSKEVGPRPVSCIRAQAVHRWPSVRIPKI